MTGKYLQNIKTCCKKVVKSNSSDWLPDNFGISVQTGCLLRHVSGSKASHLHKKNIVGPTERSKLRKQFLARRAGPAFFDEDGDLRRGIDMRAAWLNR